MINIQILNTLGLLLIYLGLTMLPSTLWSFYYQEYSDLFSIIKSSLYTIIFGCFLFAIKYFKKAVELDSNYYEALNNLGNAYMCLGNFNEAINIYEKVLALKPEYAAGYNNLASAQNDLGEFEKAIVNYDKALACFKKALKISIETGNKREEGIGTLPCVSYFK